MAMKGRERERKEDRERELIFVMKTLPPNPLIYESINGLIY
jgi:hypothetical protein